MDGCQRQAAANAFAGCSARSSSSCTSARMRSAARRFVGQAFTRPSPVPTRLVLVLPTGTEIGDLPARVTVVHDADAGLRTDYHVRRPTWMLIRPDGHIASAGDAGTPAGRPAGVLLHTALLRCTSTTCHQSITEKEVIHVAS